MHRIVSSGIMTGGHGAARPEGAHIGSKGRGDQSRYARPATGQLPRPPVAMRAVTDIGCTNKAKAGPREEPGFRGNRFPRERNGYLKGTPPQQSDWPK
jgi:hypothetical protein